MIFSFVQILKSVKNRKSGFKPENNFKIISGIKNVKHFKN